MITAPVAGWGSDPATAQRWHPSITKSKHADMEAIRNLIEQAMQVTKTDSKDGLVSLVDRIIDKLKMMGWAYMAQIEPRFVGVHRKNRYGIGILAKNMQDLGLKIVRMGWSWEACALAVCIEDCVDHRNAQFTVAMQSASNLFGRSVLSEIGFASLACGHTNQFIVAAESAADCDHDFISNDGRLSKAKIIENRPNMEEVFTKGMKWLVIRREAEELFPDLPLLIQSARQAVGQVQHGESLYELLEGIQGHISSAPADETIDWDRLANRVSQSESKFSEDIPTLCAFLRLYGGGTGGQFNARFQSFVASCAPANQCIGISTFEAIVNLKLATNSYCPNVITAVLETQANCHKSCVHSGICQFITNSEIGTLSGAAKQSMMDAEKIMHVVWKIAKVVNAEIPKNTFLLIMGDFDTAVARLVLGKSMPPHIRSVEAAAGIALKKLSELVPALSIDNPWEEKIEPETIEAVVSSAAAVLDGVFQYNEEGQVEGINKLELISKGYEAGVTVKRDGNLYTIDKINDDGEVYVRAMNADGTLTKKVLKSPIADFLTRYSKTTEKREMLQINPSNMHHSKHDTVLNVARASIFVEAAHLHAKFAPDVTIKTQPERSVYVNKSYAAGSLKLVLAPLTVSSIKESKDGNGVPHGAFIVKGHSSKSKLYVTAQASTEDIVPAAWVKTSQSKGDANVQVEHIKHTNSSIEIPILTNLKALKKGDELVRHFVPKRTVEVSIDRSFPNKRARSDKASSSKD